MMRKDITEGKKGSPLKLRARIVNVGADCAPLVGIPFEIWQCDAEGVYSGPKAGAPGKTFLRGVQMTDEAGMAEFDTIFPGWYTGRAIHIHFRVHIGSKLATSQLYFDEAFCKKLYESTEPYKARGTNFQDNATDFFAKGYKDLMPLMTPFGTGHVADMIIGVAMA